MILKESIVEDSPLAWFGELRYAVGHGLQLAPGEPATVKRYLPVRFARRLDP
jgi:hypothetical protein